MPEKLNITGKKIWDMIDKCAVTRDSLGIAEEHIGPNGECKETGNGWAIFRILDLPMTKYLGEIRSVGQILLRSRGLNPENNDPNGLLEMWLEFIPDKLSEPVDKDLKVLNGG